MSDRKKPVPSNATIRRVVEYLGEELGLTVYGQCMQRGSKETKDASYCYMYEALGDYSADDVIAYRNALKHDRVIDMTQP